MASQSQLVVSQVLISPGEYTRPHLVNTLQNTTTSGTVSGGEEMKRSLTHRTLDPADTL